MIFTDHLNKIYILFIIIIWTVNLIGQVTVTIPDTSAKKGKRITIPINVSDLSNKNVRNYKFKLMFDSNILKAKRVKDNGTLSDRYSWEIEKDINRNNVIVEAKGWLPLEGSGPIIKIVFEVIGSEGSTDLTFDYFTFNNGHPTATYGTSEFWVLNQKEVEFVRAGDGMGKISIDGIEHDLPVSLKLIKGKQYEVFAFPMDNSEFVNWTGDINSEDNPFYLTVNDNYKIQCNFDYKKYSVVVEINPSEAGTVNGTGNYKIGENVVLSASEAHGWEFKGWYENGNLLSENLTYSLIVESNILLNAEYEAKIYNLKILVNPSNGGIVSGGGFYHYKDVAELTADPNDGWKFVSWFLNGNEYSPDSSIQLNVKDNIEVTANFSRELYSVSLSSNPLDGGATSGGGFFYLDQSATIEANPNTGWKFDYWMEGDSIVSYDSISTIPIQGETNFIANFSLVTSLNEDNFDVFELSINNPYPNPFNPTSTFNFSLSETSKVYLTIFNTNGEIVYRVIDNRTFSPGKFDIKFNADRLSSGVYFYRYFIDELSSHKTTVKNGKIILIK